ncbi:IclR family transcriptional regulator [Nocardioides sp. LHD-245]|uniref:IclR family transcriptional regulator n=1 Tax=Nocardioides sp. LHD-245 TaxID=3051387 RepID=UPI0027DF3631|nr:IclR family transcriptional regulator [Nocardioides sp. LHD-245]
MPPTADPPPKGATAPARGSRTLEGLERALDVLMLFARPNTTSLGITEISRELDLPKAVVHRIVTTLCGRDFLELDPTSRRYNLGPSWLVMGSTYSQRVDVRDLTRDTLRELSATTDETSTLSIRHGYHRVYLDQVTPKRLVIMSVQVGDRFPLHAGSSGKAFLAFLPREEQEDYLDSVDLVQLTEQTKVDRDELLQELRDVRERGYAFSFGERQQGSGAVAAPLLDFESKPVAVISVCGPGDRIHPRVEELAQILLERTQAISARLGYANR